MTSLEERKRKPLTWRRKLAFTGMALVLSAMVALIAFFAADAYLHGRHDGAPNRRGYRGNIVGKKEAGEIRLVLLGGSTAYGYGVTSSESIAAHLERELSARTGKPVSVVNLAFNNQGAYSFLPTLIDYESLDYDGAIFYEGYNDLGGENKSTFRRDSPMFTMFGYYPVLPMILNEKLMIMRHGNLENAYLEGKVVFKPRETPASVRERQRRIDEGIAFAAASAPPPRRTGECGRWSFYCDSIHVAAQYALSKNRNVWVVTQPWIAESHRDQQATMSAMLRRRFQDPRVTYVNLGDAVSLEDTALSYDAMHLRGPGNRIIAQRLADVITPWIQRAR